MAAERRITLLLLYSPDSSPVNRPKIINLSVCDGKQ